VYNCINTFKSGWLTYEIDYPNTVHAGLVILLTLAGCVETALQDNPAVASNLIKP